MLPPGRVQVEVNSTFCKSSGFEVQLGHAGLMGFTSTTAAIGRACLWATRHGAVHRLLPPRAVPADRFPKEDVWDSWRDR